jgi:hypothetical protein
MCAQGITLDASVQVALYISTGIRPLLPVSDVWKHSQEFPFACVFKALLCMYTVTEMPTAIVYSLPLQKNNEKFKILAYKSTFLLRTTII